MKSSILPPLRKIIAAVTAGITALQSVCAFIPHVEKSSVVTPAHVSVDAKDGGIRTTAADLQGGAGVLMCARGRIRMEDLIAQTTTTVTKSSSFLGIRVGGSRSEDVRQQATPSSVLSAHNIFFRSREAGIACRGTVIATPQAVIAQAAGDIVFALSVLQATYHEEGWSLCLGNPVIDGLRTLERGGTLGDALAAMDPLYAKLAAIGGRPGHAGRELTAAAIEGLNTLRAFRQSASGADFLGQRLGVTGKDAKGNTVFAPRVRLGIGSYEMRQSTQYTGAGGLRAGHLHLDTSADVSFKNAYPVEVLYDALIRAKNLYLGGARLEHDFASESSGFGVTFTLGGSGGGFGIDASCEEGSGRSVTHQSLPFTVGGTLRLEVAGTASLEDAQVTAAKLAGHAGDLRIASHADTHESHRESSGFGVDFVGGVPVGGHAEFAWRDASGREVREPAGLYLKESLNADGEEFRVRGLTHLTGGVIRSQGFLRWLCESVHGEAVEEFRETDGFGFGISGGVGRIGSLRVDVEQAKYRASLNAVITGMTGTEITGRITGTTVTDPAGQRVVHEDSGTDFGFVIPLASAQTWRETAEDLRELIREEAVEEGRTEEEIRERTLRTEEALAAVEAAEAEIAAAQEKAAARLKIRESARQAPEGEDAGGRAARELARELFGDRDNRDVLNTLQAEKVRILSAKREILARTAQDAGGAGKVLLASYDRVVAEETAKQVRLAGLAAMPVDEGLQDLTFDFLPVPLFSWVSKLAAPVKGALQRGLSPVMKYAGGVTDKVKGYVSQSIWSKPAVIRGELIHRLRSQNLPGNFPVIDRFLNGTATSIKSLNLNAKTYQVSGKLESKLKSYINKLAGFEYGRIGSDEVISSQIKRKVLELVVPQGGTAIQREVLNNMANYARSRNIVLDLVVMP